MATGAVTYGSGYAAARAYSAKMSKRVADISEFEFVRLSQWDTLLATRAQDTQHTAQHTAVTTQLSGASNSGGALRNPLSPRSAAREESTRSSAAAAAAAAAGTQGSGGASPPLEQHQSASGAAGKTWGGWWEDRKQLKWTKDRMQLKWTKKLLNKACQKDTNADSEPSASSTGLALDPPELKLLFRNMCSTSCCHRHSAGMLCVGT